MSQPIGPSMPTIGRIVHFTPDGLSYVPALVTRVFDGGAVALTVFDIDTTQSGVIAQHVEQQPNQPLTPRTWCWPKVTR